MGDPYKMTKGSSDTTHHVFISYVKENGDAVDRLTRHLTGHGIHVWLDRDKIEPGTRWKPAIRQAIQEGSFFIACFSREYGEREKTFMNEELNLAIEELRQRPTTRAWFIPAILSPCEIPDREIGGGASLRDLQYVALHRDWDTGVQRLVNVIQEAFTQLRARTEEKSAARHDIENLAGELISLWGALVARQREASPSWVECGEKDDYEEKEIRYKKLRTEFKEQYHEDYDPLQILWPK